jgi:hypothetical protein
LTAGFTEAHETELESISNFKELLHNPPIGARSRRPALNSGVAVNIDIERKTSSISLSGGNSSQAVSVFESGRIISSKHTPPLEPAPTPAQDSY